MKIPCPNPSCKRELKGPKSQMGERVVCPGCGYEFIWADRFHHNASFVIYDLETTGLYPDEDEFIQIPHSSLPPSAPASPPMRSPRRRRLAGLALTLRFRAHAATPHR